MKHEIKCWPQYFCRVLDRSKTFEMRENDRGYQPGDTVIMHEWDPNGSTCNNDETPMSGPTYSQGGYTKRRVEFKIGYVLPIDDKRVVFSILEIKP